MADEMLKIALDGDIATLTIDRPDKRNAMCDQLVNEIDAFFSNPPEQAKVAILTGTGGHFCSGLDLEEHTARSGEDTLYHSRHWHSVMDKIQFGRLPVVSAMYGAVIGGGLEIAAATHVRIAEPSTMFQLPEGRRGIFVGGGATVRVGRILGADRMTEMMLTGRKYSADEGLALGLCHYSVGEGESMALARELAGKIARNAPMSNYLMMNAISRIDDMSKADGLFAESLCAALSVTTPDAAEGLRAFLDKRAPRFR
ncbi:vanillin synthase /trans-feruloyl-CoA hydratase [Primorskyibacter flagellatus]|uniref:Vanillin synthase /trans-feruloyl-CoA hydratase n=2 Tax=Primorskyibacter flagellatus TaxID=1387277 RepID=A0A1W2C055_9RHOB|nr:crotonase/enoyl-CoA hydratase family protein [Primorskyibacter flagellatus]SMC78098.1 vanillin synthase /trans-feruloyl-CoA hydratase [Primorskyibacter flagellatus]